MERLNWFEGTGTLEDNDRGKYIGEIEGWETMMVTGTHHFP